MKNIIKNLKINKVCPNYKMRRGFVVIFAILISSIFLAISLGVTNIAFKEIKFSTSGKDTNDAFFAADVGAECALYYDRSDIDRFKIPSLNSNGSITCANTTTTPSVSGNDTSWSYSFILSSFGSSNQECTRVTIAKDNSAPPVVTTITSNGFNVGDSSCNSSNQNRVSRQLQVTY